MSWGKTASGSVAEVRAAIATWKESVKQADAQYHSAADVTALHGAQVDKVVAQVEHFAETVPDGYGISVSGGGHAGITTTGLVTADQWNVSVGAYKLAAVTPS